MWLFLNHAFLSIVDKGGDGSTLLVRARKAGEIQAVFPNADVVLTPTNDYRYRARIDREQIALAIADAVRSIDFPNFKATVKDRKRHEAYMGVWEVMHHYQTQEQQKGSAQWKQ